MDDPDGHILPLASDYRKVVASLIQENACYTHAFPQVHAFFQLPGRERYFFSLRVWNLTQADVTVKTRPRAEIPDRRDDPKGLLLLLGVPYAAVLGVWVGIADLIPAVGAYLGAIPALVVAAFVGFPQFIGTLVLFIVYQQLENYLIAPRIMKHALDLSPAAVIVALLVGGSLAGFVGALLSLPVAAVIKVVARELYVSDRIEEVQQADAAQAAARAGPGRHWRRPWRRVPVPMAAGKPEDSREP